MKTEQTASMTVYPPERQGSGAFDGGRITEIKPIPFPQESGGSRRIGPLMYWAWATAHGDGVIGMHPHRGFEIMSYVLEGAVGHTDTGGNSSRVGAGGAQVMRTGSGISHQEEMHGERTDFFQIWFEPDFRESLRNKPVYSDFEAEDFSAVETADGVRVKPIIGNGGPVDLAAPVQVEDVSLDAGASYSLQVPAHHALASVVISGGGTWSADLLDEGYSVGMRDFAVLKTDADLQLTLKAGGDKTRLLNVIAPLGVDYALQF
jgi:redox-sensitive bicupin YhaK (pirin superfamily)